MSAAARLLADRLNYWAQNEEMIDAHHTEHGRDCTAAARAIKDLLSAVESLCVQFAHDAPGPSLTTGGLSALEEAFAVLGWKDPHPIAWARCDEPGCRMRSTCGFPTKDGGYRRTCFPHSGMRTTPEEP